MCSCCMPESQVVLDFTGEAFAVLCTSGAFRNKIESLQLFCELSPPCLAY